MEEKKRRGSKGAPLPGPIPVRRRSARHQAHVQPPENEEPIMAFDPSDPYSAAMDDIPLKDLFPNVKVRKRSQSKKVEASEVPSPKSTENEESVRGRLRESLAAALKKSDSSEWDQDRGQDVKGGKVGQDLDLKLMTDNMSKQDDNESLTKTEESLPKRAKLVVKEVKVEDVNNKNESSELEGSVAMNIEAELYRHFGGVNKKYKEKARSLLFNLKDRSNPELRARVLGGEITPENLCTMTTEQLASKELSQWRMAKAEEFAQMVVLVDTDGDQPRLVKKTHKGEIEVQIEKDDVLTEVVTATSQPRFALSTLQEAEVNGANVVVESTMTDLDSDNLAMEAGGDGLEMSPIRELNLTDGISSASDLVEETGEEFDEGQQEEANAVLPTILSLDEFVGSKNANQPKMPVKDDELDLKLGLNDAKSPSIISSDMLSIPSPFVMKDKVPLKAIESPKHKTLDPSSAKNLTLLQKERKEGKAKEKLWEGSFQLSGSLISPVLLLYKSGDAVELQTWPKLIEIKGRVRLDALEKFLQEVRLSRTRVVMVTACRLGEGQGDGGDSVKALKEAANQYERGERVGYAEPIPGYELYLFPGGGTSLRLLVDYGYLGSDQTSTDEEGILVGFVVYRRSVVPVNPAHKLSSHYFNANRHALSAQLDSPTHPNEGQCSGSVVSMSMTKASDNHLPLANSQGGLSNDNVEGVSLQRGHTTSGFIFSQPHDHRIGKVMLDSKDDNADDDLPPGFGPQSMAMAKGGNRRNDDDDLPEYDFAVQNPTPIFNSAKPPEMSQAQATPLNMQEPLSRTSLGLSSQPDPSIPFEQVNPSGPPVFARPVIPPVPRLLEQGRPPNPLPSQVAQPPHFHGFLPPGPPPPGPPPFGLFPSRPHLPVDGPFAVRMPRAVQMPAPILMHTEPQDTAFVASFNQPSQDRLCAPLLQSHPVPTGSGHRRGSEGSSLWDDDDDMPEWCPPEVTQPDNKHVLPRPPPHFNMELGPAGVPLRPHMGGGWQGMPVWPPPIQADGRGILQAPPPVLQYRGPGRAHFPIAARPEKFPSDRSQGTWPTETRGFKGGK